MIDPIQRMLHQGGGILARRIISELLPDNNIVDQELAIEILDRGFRYTTNRAWNTVRNNIVSQIQATLNPRLGEERTNTLLNGIETQINRIARENNIEHDNTRWLNPEGQTTFIEYYNENPNGEITRNQVRVPLSEAQMWQDRWRERNEQLARRQRHEPEPEPVNNNSHIQLANEYGERQDMDYEDYNSMVQREIQASNEIFSGTFIVQFAV